MSSSLAYSNARQRAAGHPDEFWPLRPICSNGTHRRPSPDIINVAGHRLLPAHLGGQPAAENPLGQGPATYSAVNGTRRGLGGAIYY